MRASVTLVILVAALAAFADDSNVIAWSPTRSLSWDDFQGPVPRAGDDKRVAATTASISWSFRYSVAGSASACSYTINEITSVANFHPDLSWVRPDKKKPGVLEHEQGHFDIARVYSEKFEAAAHGLVGHRGDCRGSSKRRAMDYSEAEIADLIKPVYEDVWGQYRGLQETYDSETHHGSDVSVQARWTEAIAAMLSP